MRRRDLLMAGASLFVTCRALAQPARKPVRIGVLSSAQGITVPQSILLRATKVVE